MDDSLMVELNQHYKMWTDDNTKRLTRHNGWNDIIDAYYGNLPKDWPYISRVVDPCIHTTLIEKNARILNAKLKGRLVPREGGDTVGALLNNAVLDFQWDNANEGGSMLVKCETCDMNTRLLGSVFVLNYWKYEMNDDGECTFDGNEIKPLDLRDCGMGGGDHIRNAKWFQLRTWEYLEDLEASVDADGKPVYQNLGKIKTSIAEKLGNTRSSQRNNDYVPRVKQLRGLEDRTGQDLAFPVVKLVTEYRKDRWITFAPDYDVILRDIDNPYNHGKIPINQLRYYPIQDEPIGESEVEPVLGIWRAIQATLCGYLDEMILKMRPPLKIMENAARVETINYGPEAQWLVTRQDAIEEMKSNGDSLAYFQTTYQALKSAFNVAMGDLSEQTHATDAFAKDAKTATEIKASLNQQNVRDQKNQNDFGEFIKDIMMMWLENNKQFLFSNPDKQEYVIRIVGKDKWAKLQEIGLDQSNVMPETMMMLSDIIKQHPEIGDAQLEQLYEAGKLPNYPIILNPKEKDPAKLEMKPKMSVSEHGDIADVTLIPQDLEGTYDYVPDVKSMSMGASDMLIQARQQAINRLTTNPAVLQLLGQEGYQVNLKDLLVDDFEDTGLTDADKYFTKAQAPQAGGAQMGGALPNQPVQGLPGLSQANPTGGIPQQMVRPESAGPAGATNVPNPGIVPQGL